jgi:hypothetical protein
MDEFGMERNLRRFGGYSLTAHVPISHYWNALLIFSTSFQNNKKKGKYVIKLSTVLSVCEGRSTLFLI